MIVLTLLYGVLIASLGIIGYFATGQVSKTALIPCIFALPVIVLGIFSWWKVKSRRKMQIAATAIALLSFFGTVKGVGGLITMISGGVVDRPSAVMVQAIMAIASLLYVLISGINLSRKRRC